MNGRERVGRMLSGQPLDRRPFAPVLSLYGARLTYQDVRAYYTDAKAYAAGQRAVAQLFAPDILFAPFGLTTEAAAFGGEEHFLARHPPNLKAPVLRHARDLGTLHPPDLEHPRLRYVRESVRRLKGEQGARAMICAICLSPTDSPAMILGLEGWLEVLLFDPEGTRAALAVTVPFFVQWANALLGDGADFLALPVAFANPAVVTEEMLSATFLPVMREAFAQVKGPIVFHHAGGPLGPFLPLLKDLPNVAGFALDSRDSLAQGRAAIGPGKLLLGNVDGPTLSQSTAGQVLERARRVLKEVEGDPLFVLATSSADIPWATPPANILALREAVEGEASPKRSGELTVCACSIHKDVVERMEWPEGRPDRELFFDSALHMDPDELDLMVGSIVDFERSQGRKVVVAFGDCASHLDERCRAPGCARLPGQNCCEARLGHERFKDLRRRGAFIYLPEWVGRWREMLAKAVGCDDDGMLRDIVTDNNERIVFLVREGEEPPPRELVEIREFFGLPVSVEVVPESVFATSLRAICSELRATKE